MANDMPDRKSNANAKKRAGRELVPPPNMPALSSSKMVARVEKNLWARFWVLMTMSVCFLPGFYFLINDADVVLNQAVELYVYFCVYFY